MKKMMFLSLLVICGCSTMGSKQTSTQPVTTKTELNATKKARVKEAPTEKTMSTDDSSPISSSSKVTFLIKYKLKNNPSGKAAVVKSLERGEKAQVIKQQGDWFQVELASGGIGWCHQSAIALAKIE